MAVPSLLLELAIILIAAEIGGTAFRLLRMPRVVGMLVAGIVLGPFTPGYVVDPAGIADLALLGAVFLMFSVGLSFDIRTFRRLGAAPFLLAGAGVVASFGLGYLLGAIAGWPMLGSLFLGLILTSTSTTLGVKFLADFGLTDIPGAELVTAAILVDDIIALFLVTIAVGIASPAPVPVSSLVAGLLVILGLAALLLWVGSHALPRILRATDRLSPSSTVMVAVALALFVSFAFTLLGLPPLVGAFFAGSIVASTEYGARVTRHMAPVTAIFMAVFFTSIGFLIDPGRLPGVALLATATVGIAVVAKVLPGAFVLRSVARVPPAQAWALSTVLIPRAEISLIIAQYGITIGGPQELLALTMAVMIVTALVPAPIMRLLARRAKGSGVAATGSP